VRPNCDTLYVPNWDQDTQKQVRDALRSLDSTLADLRRGGGSRDEVDPVRHLIATAAGWGLNPDTDAIYLNVTPAGNDGRGIYRLTKRHRGVTAKRQRPLRPSLAEHMGHVQVQVQGQPRIGRPTRLGGRRCPAGT
jgi:hypothetical protein